ncbi:DgyrCDS6372 [Dimorphilus gyrociliatus]|uniref:DgyrCDS6372 n=1 Tax=Dimorphilus gyrociliatus TaxID=2664684 RepID=A0A7I8VMV5_9ANNE|nr:DgyrCDS6372 [Dimorphilus gyrociliatus]
MEPLGVESEFTNIEELPKWSQTVAPDYEIVCNDPNVLDNCSFKLDDELNSKIIVWTGDITKLKCEAIVNSTSESFGDKSPLNQRIFAKAGPELKEEVRRNIKVCKTGDSKLTKAYKLPCRSIIHTVGPRYNIRYKTAAESALFNCYRSCLNLVREYNIRTISIPCIHSSRRGYPSYEGAHIAIRTIRRFLETYGSHVDSVAFVVAGEDDDVYNSLMPLYFPRNRDEAIFSAVHLPYDTGSRETGEPVIAERIIRIEGKPQRAHAPDFLTSVDINEVFETSVAVGRHPFSRPQANPDKRRTRPPMSTDQINAFNHHQFRYNQWIAKAKSEDLFQVERLRWLYHSGYDRRGRPVIVVIGKHFRPSVCNPEKAVMHVIRTMDSIVSKPFVVAYFHTKTERKHIPETGVVKETYNLLDNRYKKNMHAFYILHASLWTKIQSWFFSTFNVSEIKNRIVHIPGLEYLYSRIGPDQLDLPSFILEHDITVELII